ncbi:MAG: hypothetical protein ABIP27_18180 [Flavobacterium circumlabens]|uniref:Uncharacterized protein n=1 Tax=Flavobacterium circumlabens TaxID=2133765 RepID=A0A4Y7UHK1_9FLAO|nr:MULTISPECIES: hypothetical protein [Flavobacterium]QSB25437.1 hypothetical protein HAV12_013750 [Flavobacterium sp. CLA17]TCN60094.1 hypothetical protein EV142_102714 [Flavobacterium circumlabens]TEB45322.1 hypothetical protein D0809_09170 [Flavobacterium circumlabens]
MENVNNYNSEDLQKCPYHAQLNTMADDKNQNEHVNTGDWEDGSDEDGTDPDRYEEEKEEGNNNSGGAGSTGSAATNS